MLYNRVLYTNMYARALIISFFYNKENKYGLENDLTKLYKTVLGLFLLMILLSKIQDL